MEAENFNPFQKLFQKLFKNIKFIFTEKLNWEFTEKESESINQIWEMFTFSYYYFL